MEENNEVYDDQQWVRDMSKELDEEIYNRINFPKPEKWGELNKKQFNPAKWRIKDILPWEGYVILAGVSGDRKTWLALEMAKSVALGIPFVGNKDFSSEPGAVLYIDSEMSQSELQRRCRLLGFDDSQNDIFISNGVDLNLNDNTRVPQLIELIKDKDIKLVVIDTLRASAGGLKEEKAEEVRMYFNRFKEIKSMGVVVVFLDHFRKPNHFEGKVPKKEHLFSSQDKTACVEGLIMIQTDDGSDETKVYQRKNRLGPEFKPFTVKMEDIFDKDFNLESIKISYLGEMDENGNKKEEAMECALIILEEGEMTVKQLLSRIKGVGERNIRDALKDLVVSKILVQDKKGKEHIYRLNDKPVVPTELVAGRKKCPRSTYF